MDEMTTVRWVWGYDTIGRRVTVAEAIAVGPCPGCGSHHPIRSAQQHGPGWPPALLPNKKSRDLIGFTTSEFPPDDDDRAVV